MRRAHLFALATLFAACFLTPHASHAQETTALATINKALQNLPPQSGRFHQALSTGASARGFFHMNWPSHLRFAYDAGGAVVTVKDKFLAVQDKAKTEPNWFPVSLTPLSVLRQAVEDGIQPDMVVMRQEEADFVALALRDPDGNLPGTATLYFAKPGLQLYAWRLLDVQNLVTHVRLHDIETHKTLPDSVFAIEYDEEADDE